MTKFNVGDKVEITDSGREHHIGLRGVIVLDDDSGIAPYRVRLTDGIFTWKYGKFLSLVKPDADRRLTEAEAKIATLEAEVKALKDASKPKKFVVEARSAALDIDRKTSELYSKFAKEWQTPNQRRADVIKRAQAFVADLEKRADSATSNDAGNYLFNECGTKLTFHINAEKGVVTALAHSSLWDERGKPRGKAFAKCAPGDVFNASIGKAVAAGRLYGVKVPKEFTDAVKPTEVVVGMRVDSLIIPGKLNVITEVAGDRAYVDGTNRYWELSRVNKSYVIIDDTDAVYE